MNIEIGKRQQESAKDKEEEGEAHLFRGDKHRQTRDSQMGK